MTIVFFSVLHGLWAFVMQKKSFTGSYHCLFDKEYVISGGYYTTFSEMFEELSSIDGHRGSTM